MSKKWPNSTPIEKTVKTVEDTQTAFFYPTGNVWREEYRNRVGELHRAGAPVIIAWHPNNQVWLHKYYHHGNPRRKGGPAIVEYGEQDNLEHLEYYMHGSLVAPLPQQENIELIQVFLPPISRRRPTVLSGTKPT